VFISSRRGLTPPRDFPLQGGIDYTEGLGHDFLTALIVARNTTSHGFARHKNLGSRRLLV
jgi:hypothetical protein